MTLQTSPNAASSLAADFGETDGDALGQKGKLAGDDDVPDATDQPDAAVQPADLNGDRLYVEDLERTRLAGISIHRVTEEQVVRVILSELAVGRGGTVVTPNLDHLFRANKGVSFKALVADFDLVVADGMPLVWASRIQGTPLPERVAGSNLINSLSAGAAEQRRSLFLLGGDPGTAEGSAKVLKERHPEIRIAGTHCPERGYEQNPVRFAQIVDALRDAQPDIVFVALGSPKQERLIRQLQPTLPRAWWLGIGISFSFITGEVSRAPAWMRNNGLEWIHRLYQEPGRLGKRYLFDGPPYAAKLLMGSLFERVSGRARVVPAPGRLSPEPVNGSATPAAPVQPEMPAVRAEDHAGDIVSHQAQPAEGNERDVLRDLREMILLGGQALPSRLAVAAERPVLEMPLCRRADHAEQHPGKMERLIDGWLRWGEGVAELAGQDFLPTRLVFNPNQRLPSAVSPPGVVPRPAGAFTVETDISPHRGTGGLLHDLVLGQDPSALVLVCTARQVMIDPLVAVVRTLAGRIARGADAAIIAHRDGTPAGVMLIRSGVLQSIKAVGYVDMKQQALPELRNRFDIRVVRSRRATGIPIFGATSYIQAVGRYHAQRDGRGFEAPPLGIPLAEDFGCHFTLVEDGAQVDSSV
ncbi:MAG: WecB/TagA/CpsF family glycosyltransferase, partial [Planctomycetota bacterium]